MNLTRKSVTPAAVIALAIGLSLAGSMSSSASSIPFKHPGAIALDHQGHLWVANSDYFGITEIQASTGKVLKVINDKADGFIDPYGIAVSGNNVWIVNGGVSYANGTSHVGLVTELNAANGALVRTVSLKRHGITGLSAVSVDGNGVWIVADQGSRLAELSNSSGKVLLIHRGRLRFDESSGIAAYGADVWIPSQEVCDGCVVERSAVTGSKIRSITPVYKEVPPGGGGRIPTLLGPQYVSADSHYVWTANQGALSVKLGSGSVTQIDASTGKIVRTIDTAQDRFGVISDIVSDGTHVWVVNGTYSGRGRRHGDTVTELNATNGSLVRVIRLHDGSYSDPVGLVSNGVNVWVTDPSGGKNGGHGDVIELNASTGKVVRTIWG